VLIADPHPRPRWRTTRSASSGTRTNWRPAAHVPDRGRYVYEADIYFSTWENWLSLDDPMWIVFSTGSCDQQTPGNPDGPNECANGTLGVGVSGNIQIKWLRAFLPPS
jgi:hypothetical protein